MEKTQTGEKPAGIALGFWVLGAVLLALFGKPLYDLVTYALGTKLHSHVVLVPLISGYLFYQERETILARRGKPAWVPAAVCFAVSAVLWVLWQRAGEMHENDRIAIVGLAFVVAVIGCGFGILGLGGMREAAFPFGFLIFLVPLPDAAVEGIENFLVLGSAEASDWLFALSGTPYYREGTLFQLPNILLEVARECSGIRSSWVLFITSILASYMLLQNPWHRLIIVACIVPLGILRNGIRILTIGMLCVYVGPEMIDSFVHKRGGPLFFALSLIPLFALLYFLWRREAKGAEKEEPGGGTRDG